MEFIKSFFKMKKTERLRFLSLSVLDRVLKIVHVHLVPGARRRWPIVSPVVADRVRRVSPNATRIPNSIKMIVRDFILYLIGMLEKITGFTRFNI